MMHLHHMVPKHSSYFDYLGDIKEDPYYKIYLTPEGHISQHQVLFAAFGDPYDKIACNGLVGKNVKREVYSEAGKRGGRAKPSPEAREKMRQAKLGRKLSQRQKDAISKGNKGVKKTFTEEHKQNISKSLIGNNRGAGNKGRTPWNKGIKQSDYIPKGELEKLSLDRKPADDG